MNLNRYLDKFTYMYVGIVLLILIYTVFSKPFALYDCYYTLGVMHHPFSVMVGDLLVNVHPPLYYFILKAFIYLFNPSNIIYLSKLVSILPLVLILALIFTKVRKDFGCEAACVFAILLASSMQVMYYSSLVRMYSWALFFVTVQFVFAYDLIYRQDNRLSWAIFAAAGICSAYTHYFAAATSIIIYILLLLYLKRSQLKIWAAAVILSIIAYLPWISIFLNQFGAVRDDFWIKPIAFNTIIEYFGFIFQPMDNIFGIVVALLFIISFLVIFYLNFKDDGFDDDKSRFSILLFSTIFLTMILGIVLSILIRPIFIARYMLPALGGFLLSFSILLSNIRANSKVYNIILCIVIIFSICGVVGFCQQADIDYNHTLNDFEFLDSINSSDVVVFNDDLSQLRYEPYLNSTTLFAKDLNEIDGRYPDFKVVIFDKHKQADGLNYKVEKIGEIYQDQVYSVNG